MTWSERAQPLSGVHNARRACLTWAARAPRAADVSDATPKDAPVRQSRRGSLEGWFHQPRVSHAEGARARVPASTARQPPTRNVPACSRPPGRSFRRRGGQFPVVRHVDGDGCRRQVIRDCGGPGRRPARPEQRRARHCDAAAVSAVSREEPRDVRSEAWGWVYLSIRSCSDRTKYGRGWDNNYLSVRNFVVSCGVLRGGGGRGGADHLRRMQRAALGVRPFTTAMLSPLRCVDLREAWLY